MLPMKIINSKNTEFVERCTRITMTIAKHLHKMSPAFWKFRFNYHFLLIEINYACHAISKIDSGDTKINLASIKTCL